MPAGRVGPVVHPRNGLLVGSAGTKRRTLAAPAAGIVDRPVATMVADRIGIQLQGQASKRGLIPRLPGGERLLGDVETWLRTDYSDTVVSVRTRTLPTGEAVLEARLHPAAPPVLLTADDEGRVTAAAETTAAGPGYHRFVGRVLERLGIELAVAWDLAAASGSPFSDRSAAERDYLAWLGPILGRAREARRRGANGIHVAMPPGTRFSVSEAIATVLGPRDDRWLDAAIADPRIAIDMTPWWSDATGARYLLDRALCLMWLDVRWRGPAIPGEAELMDEVHRLLSRAFPLEPELPYPWHAWAELATLRGIDDQMARQAAGRAARSPEPETLVGYRRAPVVVTHEGWALQVPGSFAERRTAEEWWGGGAGRSVTLAATVTGTETGPMRPQAFLDQVAGDLGPEALNHHDGDVIGRARLTSDASSGVEVGILEGYSAVTGSGAAVRIEFDDPADWQWALDLWRSLAPA